MKRKKVFGASDDHLLPVSHPLVMVPYGVDALVVPSGLLETRSWAEASVCSPGWSMCSQRGRDMHRDGMPNTRGDGGVRSVRVQSWI